jgi:hypothetical protein
VPAPNNLPPDNKRPIQPLDTRRRREILVYSEISRYAAQNRIYMTVEQKGALAREIVGRLEKGGELSVNPTR